MSNVSAFLKGQIKSIQRGEIGIFNGVSATATISAVNTSKALLSTLGWVVTANDATHVPRLTLTDSTTITATRAANTTVTSVIAWQLVEYY